MNYDNILEKIFVVQEYNANHLMLSLQQLYQF